MLADKVAVDALLGVSAYLRTHTRPGREVFSLRDDTGRPTFDMAAEFAGGDARMAELWRTEQAAAAARQAGHWTEVMRKQVLARDLRGELARCQARLRTKEASFTQASDARSAAYHRHMAARWNTYYTQYSEAQDAENACQAAVTAERAEKRRIQAALAEAEKSPSAVIQPLPSKAGQALAWLFFLYMPPAFRHLSRASFLAQQLTLPRPPWPSMTAAESRCTCRGPCTGRSCWSPVDVPQTFRTRCMHLTGYHCTLPN